jgi:hypothetical protein
MGLIQPKSYKKKNRLTGLWELIKPEPVEFTIGLKRGGKNKMPDLKHSA